jgi:hypothetical protein
VTYGCDAKALPAARTCSRSSGMNRVVYKVEGETIYIAYIIDCRQDLQRLVDMLVLMA